ncbi:MAG: hypothetical protein HYS13_02275, partial [Planctomycetia bacterium]|nr:hypothetical protein [Planctomycetia bacterium]
TPSPLAGEGWGGGFGDPRPPQRRLTDAEKREIDALVAPILAAEEELAESPAAVS